MLLLALFYQISPFPERNDNLLKGNEKIFDISASGSIGQFRNGKCVETQPDGLFDSDDKKEDWCSNVNKSKTDKPWLGFSLKGKAIFLTGYAIRSGCCYYPCCCIDGKYIDGCCCDLYSWSLQGSHDNSTWKTLHTIDKDRTFYGCANRQYDIEAKESFEFLRIIQEQPWPGCNYCMCINKVQFYGKTVDGAYQSTDEDDSDESISIIGRIQNNNV